MTSSIVLGVDLATSAARVTAVDASDGTLLGYVGAALDAPRRSDDGGSRQHPRYAEVVLGLLAATADRLGDKASEVAALAITGTSGSMVPCDADGRPVGDTVMYDDTAAGEDARRLQDAGIAAGPGSAAARIGLLHRTTDAALLLHTPDVVLAALAGTVLPTDTSHALKAGVDPVARRWPELALDALGVDPSMLPDLVPPGRPVGALTAEIAARTGLPQATMVSGMTDGCTAQIACGAVRPGDTVGVLGTTLVFKGVSGNEVTAPDGSVYSHYGPDGSWWPGAASNVGAGVLAGLVPATELAAMDAAAGRRGPSTVLRYPLTRTGERYPVLDPGYPGWQLGEPADQVDAYRAVLDGVAFTERYGLERLAGLGLDRGTHRLAGGATRSQVWNRIRATVLGTEVLVPPAAGSGYGAAALAAAGVRDESLTATVDRWSAGETATVGPDPARVAELDERYQQWREELLRRAAPDHRREETG